MTFDALPKDLKNIVSGFAYDCKWEIALKDMRMCEELSEMDLNSVFTRDVMWSLKYRAYIPCPMKQFEPIQNFTGSWADYIDWHAVQELLWRLDFRRRFVRMVHTRAEWRELFRQNWKNVLIFDGFFRFLLYTRVPCFKPLWKPCGFRQLKSYRSPYVSARWFIDGIMD
jgi:hypothetical protein